MTPTKKNKTPLLITDPFESSTDSHSNFFHSIWRLRHWMWPYRWRITIAVLFALLSATAAVLIPVVFSRVVIDDILMHSKSVNAPDLGQRALTHWLSGSLAIEPLLAASALYFLWIILRAGLGYLFETQFSSAVLVGIGDLRRDLFAHVEHLPAAFFDRARVGQILTRITNDIESLSDMLTSVGIMAGEIIPFTVAICVMLSLDSTLTAEISPFLLIIIFVTLVFRLFSGPIYRRIIDTNTRLNEHLHENLSGIETVQLFHREALNVKRFTALNKNNRTQEGNAIRIETAYYPFIENISYLTIACILWLGEQHVLNHTATLGSIVLFLQFSDMLFRPVVVVSTQASIIFRAAVACERIFRLLDWKEKLSVPSHPTPLPTALHGHIEFKDLNFSYETGETVIQHFNLVIKPGETIAIVGHTGSGKTTLMRLLCRFYDVPPDSLFIDHIDIMQIAPSEIRKRVGVILQDFHLFPGTIYDNITLGNPEITLEDAYRAASLVQALDFVNALPLGFETVLEDRGNNLSQGQRQLLAFARVIALDPEILILDEATACIDPATELAIQAALLSVIANRTTLIIAHRLQTIRNADRIVVLDQGEIVEEGKHDELLSHNSFYKTLYEAQLNRVHND